MKAGKIVAIAVFTVAGLVLAVGGTAHVAGYTYNLTDSEPEGVWQKIGSVADMRRGDIVEVCLPTETPAIARLRAMRYFGGVGCPDTMTPLLKPAAALPGDVVQVNAVSGISVNGTLLPNTAQLARDGAGHLLPHTPDGRYTVPPGMVWLISTYNPISLDSRYFGPVPIAGVRAVMRPVWTRQ